MVVKSYNLVEKVFLFSCSIYLIGSNWEFLEVNCMKVIKNHIFFNYILTVRYCFFPAFTNDPHYVAALLRENYP